MIYLKIIFEQIKSNLLIIGVGLLGILTMINTFLPRNSKFKKVLTWFTKR
tara:strand:+ start:209 stop:358 length:150 start_codon:yes stop_codon:yes gene_type:complete